MKGRSSNALLSSSLWLLINYSQLSSEHLVLTCMAMGMRNFFRIQGFAKWEWAMEHINHYYFYYGDCFMVY